MGLFLILSKSLGKMLRNELGHFKHADRGLAAENLLQVFVRIDVPLILLVLQTVLFDVDPEFFDDFRARHWTLTNDGGEFSAHSHRFHKSGIYFLFHFGCLVRFLDFGGIILIREKIVNPEP